MFHTTNLRRAMASKAFHDRVQDYATKLRERRVVTSLDAAKGTAELLRQLVTSSRMTDAQSLLDEVKNVGSILQAANPTGKCFHAREPGLPPLLPPPLPLSHPRRRVADEPVDTPP